MAAGFYLVCFLSVAGGLLIAGTMSAPLKIACCPAGWTPFGHRCFIFFHEAREWIFGEHVCRSLGGNLASIHTPEENAFLGDYIEKVAGSRVHTWIGGTDEAQEGTWLWTDGSPFNYQSWSPGEPNNLGQEHCIEMNWREYFWNDNQCYHERAYLCAKDQI
ncbi:galactose-specific lectin nattectin-like [Plectropomus leopardus]|uniref:galactose-specific lectin nattectin-like n=1 Tax=Plectropomus leopardus TaxID=160734 RepID=UPI001C4DCE0F|nr:galactose-specific lectin nattectin-like [Plectropomus leopardus]